MLANLIAKCVCVFCVPKYKIAEKTKKKKTTTCPKVFKIFVLSERNNFIIVLKNTSYYTLSTPNTRVQLQKYQPLRIPRRTVIIS